MLPRLQPLWFSATMASPEELQHLYCTHGLASEVFPTSQTKVIAQLVETLKHFQKVCRDQFVQDNAAAPLLCSYSFDATRTMLSTTQSSKAPAGAVLRKGQLSQELLMQRLVLRVPPSLATENVLMVFAEPVSLGSGKGMWHVFSAACKFAPLPRSLGHKGPLLQHVCADRAQLSAVSRLLQGRSRLYYESLSTSSAPAALLSELDFFLSCGCGLHDVHNSLKWALSPYTQGEVLKDSHIVLEALRNSHLPLILSVPSFLESSLSIRSEPTSESATRQFWSLMGVEASHLELFVNRDPHYSEGVLSVNGTLDEDFSALMEEASACVMILLQFQAWSDSRFGSMTVGAKRLVAALSVGLESIVEASKSCPLTSSYHLNGFFRLNSKLRRFFVVTAIAGGLTLELSNIIMADDRLLLHQSEFKDCLSDEIFFVHGLEDSVWQRLCAIAKTEDSWRMLRSEVLNAVHVAAGYVTDKIVSQWQEYPWRLAALPPEQALAELREARQPPDNAVALQIWRLMQVGYSDEKLHTLLQLMRHTSWSTLNVEQAHGSSATVRTFHPSMSLDMHLMRAYLHQCRHLFTTSLEEKREQKLVVRREGLLQKRTPRITARQAYFQQCVRQLQLTVGHTSLSPSVLRVLMQQHVHQFRRLTVAQLRAYEGEAALMTEQKKQQLQEDLAYVDSQLRIHRMRSAEALATYGLPNFASSVKLSAGDLGKLFTAWTMNSWTPSSIRSLRSAACEPSEAPPDPVSEKFSAAAQALQLTKRADPPEWVKVLCEYREALQGLILLPEVADGSVAYRFLFASQNPRFAVFQNLVVAKSAKPELPLMEDGWPHLFQYVDAYVPWTFQLLPCEYSKHVQLPDLEPHQIYVLEDGLYVEQSQLHCYGTLQRLDDLLRAYPHHHLHTSEPKAKKARAAATPLLAEEAEAHPWLHRYLPESSRKQAPHSSSSSASHTASQQPTAALASEDKIAAVWASLAEVRAEWAAVDMWQGDDFRMSLRGGQWTAAHRGCVTDAVAAQVASDTGRQWVSMYQEQRMATFSSLRYTQRIATLLASEWCRKRQFFLNVWLQHGGGPHHYTAAEVESYQSSPEWSDFVRDTAPTHQALERATALNEWVPRLPDAPAAFRFKLGPLRKTGPCLPRVHHCVITDMYITTQNPLMS